MEFIDLPHDVQVIAAKALAEKLLQPQGDKKPAELALEIKEVFEGLYGIPSEVQFRVIEAAMTSINLRVDDILSKMTGAEKIVS